MPKSCLDLRSVFARGRGNGDDTSWDELQAIQFMEGVSANPRDVSMLTLRKRDENGTNPPSKESTKLMNNLPGSCTASAHGVSLNVVETIVRGT